MKSDKIDLFIYFSIDLMSLKRLIFMLPDELIASILVYVSGNDLLKYLKFFNKSFGSVIQKYGKLFNVELSDITDADLYYLSGVGKIDLSYCDLITDAGLAHLQGVHTINLLDCWLITDAGLDHLKGVHTVDLSCCYGITDAGLEHLLGVHTISLSNCMQITDAGLVWIRGIHTIDLYNCKQITDTGLCAFKRSAYHQFVVLHGDN